jgi:hypothetical protein
MSEKFTSILVIILILIILCVFMILNEKNQIKEGFHSFLKSKHRYNTSVSPPWVLNQEMSPMVYKITKEILASVNQKLNTNYQMGQYENLIEDYDNDGNKRFIIDFFVYQFNHQHVNDLNRRLIVDVTLLKNTNNLRINTLNFSNAIKYQDPSIIAEDPESTLILKDDITGKTNDISVIKKTSLENTPFLEPAKLNLNDIHRGPWILPLEIQEKKNLRAFPCQDYGDWWDENAIPLTAEQELGLPKKQQPKWCYGSYNSATKPQYIVAQRRPQFLKQPSDRHYNDWMFDRRIGITGFPHGSSSS